MHRAAEVRFAKGEQFFGKVYVSMRRAEHQLVGGANLCGEVRMFVVCTKPAWTKPIGILFSSRDNQPGRIEVGLRKNELFEDARRHGLRDATLRRLVAQDFRDARRVGIAKRAELIHSDVAAGSEVPRSSDPLSYAAGGRGDKEKGAEVGGHFALIATSRLGFSLAFFAIVGFAFPAAVNPPILFGRFADDLLELVGVPLSQQRHAAIGKVRLERIANCGRADFVV